MIQNELFKIDQDKTVKPKPGKRCKNCVHIYEHQYNSTKYCDAQKQNGTSYGHRKIKSNDPACPLFESIK